MILKKITVGFVIQTFDTDTGKCTSQEFVAGDQVDFELPPFGDKYVNDDVTEGLYYPFDMKQPDA